MSQRGRKLLDRYVETHLRGPLSFALTVQSHVHSLRSHCKEQGVSPQEVVEEVGDLIEAITEARNGT